MFTYHRQDQEKLLASEDLERTQVLMLMGKGAADATSCGREFVYIDCVHVMCATQSSRALA